MKISTALLSVSDKTGLVEFARGLSQLGIRLISTGGTARSLSAAALEIANVADVTGFPEMLDGRVKTLHPAVHGGILADRSKPEHMQTIADHEITPIDMVVVNLYPFRETVAKSGASREEIIENIDIGGPAMVRSSAKNHASVTIIVSPGDYGAVLDELKSNSRETRLETREKLAAKAFRHTADYDAAIAKYLESNL